MTVGSGEVSEKQSTVPYPQQQDLYPRLTTPDFRSRSRSRNRNRNNIDPSREVGKRNIGHDLDGHGEHCEEEGGQDWDHPVWTPPLPPNGSFLNGDNDSARQEHQDSWFSHSLALNTTSLTLGDIDSSIRPGHDAADAAVSARRHRSPSYPRRNVMIAPNCSQPSSDQPQDRRSPLTLRTPGGIIPMTSTSSVLPQEGVGSSLTNVLERPVQGATTFIQGSRQPTSLQQHVAYKKTQNQSHSEEIKKPQKRRRSSMTEKRLPGEVMKLL